MYAQLVIRTALFIGTMAIAGYAGGWIFGYTFDKGLARSSPKLKEVQDEVKNDNVVSIK